MPLGRIVLYVRDIEVSIAFYERHFGYVSKREAGDRIIELCCRDGGANLMIHRASKGVKTGQVTVKLVFDVNDVDAFCAACARNGLSFGTVHKVDGYSFANAKDPDGNSISVSSRAFRTHSA